MSASVTLFSDRVDFEPTWRAALESAGLSVRAGRPDELPSVADRVGGMVVDAASSAYDEDELLTAVALARALGSTVAVHLPDALASVEDVVDEMCPGLVARTSDDVSRVANALARKLDRERGRRFEYVTVSPRSAEVLAILGDGRSVILPRPVADRDDGSDVVSIDLGEDASSAVLGLSSGISVELRAAAVAAKAEPPHAAAGNGSGNGVPIDGARLGQRLRELRLAAGLTQAELARRTGIHRPNIARVEAGRHTPSLETLARIATAIGVPTTRVLSEE